MEEVVCRLCGGRNCGIIYSGPIRMGGLGQYTQQNVPMYQCESCGVIWHDLILHGGLGQYYESEAYRASMDEGSDEDVFYRNHDRETLDKLTYTGTELFRDKVVADIGCGAGAFLDFLSGVSKSIVAIEPSKAYQRILSRKGFFTYSYASDALPDWEGKVDVITSFDVIEHVEDPVAFLSDAYELVSPTGVVITGTPTDAPIMRRLLGTHYEKQVLFSVQHLWIFSKESLMLMAQKAGFRRIEVKYFQRYGVENMLGWCLNKRPKAAINDPFLRSELDPVWRGACSARELADYIVLYAWK